jgi:hypothetical protein
VRENSATNLNRPNQSPIYFCKKLIFHFVQH